MKSLLELKVVLNTTEPSVWRRLVVPDSITLNELHHSIQIAFGWQNYHLYVYTANGIAYGDPVLIEDIECRNDKDVLLAELLSNSGDRIEYEYDFGDSWRHTVHLEKVSPNNPNLETPICIDGEMACPPEDCGGVPGYEHLMEVMKNKKHPEYNEMVAWLGKPFDPKKLNLQKINDKLKKLKNYIQEYEAS